MATRSPQQQALFDESGCFMTNEKLVSFLYELMRDHVPPGTIQRIVENSQGSPTELTNGWLARYAAFLADRLR